MNIEYINTTNAIKQTNNYLKCHNCNKQINTN